MAAPDLSLLLKRRFAPLFVVQFLGAFNDNLLKFALLFLANFSLYAAEPDKAKLLATIATGLFILPYFLFSALAGQLADAWDKAKLVRIVKTAEVGIMSLALGGFWLQSVPMLLGSLFLMGLHSTIFGPVKFSILPQHLHKNEIMGGTGLIEAGTFLAILGGQLLAGIIPTMTAGFVAIGIALLGFVASLFVPSAPSAAEGLKIERNILKSTWTILKAARHGRMVWFSILGISWFFAVGAILLAEFAPLVSGVLGARQEVATLFLLIFSLSVAFGSLLVNRLLRGQVSARYVPIAALALAGCMIDLWLSTSAYRIVSPGAGIREFVETPGSWRIMADLFGIAFAGGMFIVPLYAILQTHSPVEERSRTIAANNITNAAITVAVVGVVSLMLAGGETVPGIIGVLGFATLMGALISCWVLPDAAFAFGKTRPRPRPGG
ncbi:MAG: MFS transporter [Sphingobium sp.]|uniref:MFS transporter n=1 Tax=Sphingobium sp. TaxID=1912891 RepID=UPI0029B5CD60|nr:MFS transporter [Sphingobium sp.]MDX3909174.1 MFS transporter [Sphingobium sp.]